MNYRNAYKSRDGIISCEVEHPEYGWIPFTASANDSTEHGKELYTAMDGDPETHQETDEQYDERVSKMVRAKRDRMLTSIVDPAVSNQIRFNELSTAKQDEWKAYRTALLDITAQEGFPHDIIWPTKPE